LLKGRARVSMKCMALSLEAASAGCSLARDPVKMQGNANGTGSHARSKRMRRWVRWVHGLVRARFGRASRRGERKVREQGRDVWFDGRRSSSGQSGRGPALHGRQTANGTDTPRSVRAFDGIDGTRFGRGRGVVGETGQYTGGGTWNSLIGKSRAFEPAPPYTCGKNFKNFKGERAQRAQTWFVCVLQSSNMHVITCDM
jgi:hypothetical protein